MQSTQLAPNPLTLLSSARIDYVIDSFVLLGTDGNHVRWARLGLEGPLGDWHEMVVPDHVGGPWFAVAGTSGPADHLVVAYAANAAGGVMSDLMTLSVPFDNTTPASPVTAIGQLPDVRSNPVTVAMASGRAGMNAGLVWAVQGTTSVTVFILDGTGHAPAGAQTIAQMIGGFSCLRFLPGKQDLTVGVTESSGTPPKFTFVGTEISDTGAIRPSFNLTMGTQNPGCLEMVPVDSGYGLAWHSEGIGYLFGIYNTTTQTFPSELVLGDVTIRERPIPPLGGLGWTGKNYTLVFDHRSGGEMWEIDAMAQKIGGALVFPSTQQNTGAISTQPVGTNLYATYADYASPDPTNQAAGQRLLVHATCP